MIVGTPSHGGAGLSSHIEDPLGEWRKGIGDRMSFLAEPDQHRAKMLSLAHAALNRRMIDRGELSDMLEWLDCAKIWAEVEMAEAEWLGLFDGCESEPGMHLGREGGSRRSRAGAQGWCSGVTLCTMRAGSDQA